MKRLNKTLFLLGVLTLSSVAMAREVTTMQSKNNVVVVCREKQCKPANATMTRDFLYNKLGSLLQNNIGKKVLFCDADPQVHVCLNDAITFEAKVGATQTPVKMISASVIDAKSKNEEKYQQFILDYSIEVGKTHPKCQASLNKLVVPSADNVAIEAPGFECRFTENGITLVNASYDVDYIDFDYGILGAHYTLGVGQVSKGGNTGYALLRFQVPVNPNNEILESQGCSCEEKQNPPCQCASRQEPEIVLQEKVITQYEVAPIELFVRTKAPVEAGSMQPVRINGVDVANVPVVPDLPPQERVVIPQMRNVEIDGVVVENVPVLPEYHFETVEKVVNDDELVPVKLDEQKEQKYDFPVVLSVEETK